LANLATKAGVQALANTGSPAIKIHAPLIDLTKAQIIARGLELGVDYSITSSCYDPQPDGTACGYCDSCLLRQAGFQQNGVSDPIAYTR
jgi:7-cyano-7-deazaguanine synthase